MGEVEPYRPSILDPNIEEFVPIQILIERK